MKVFTALAWRRHALIAVVAAVLISFAAAPSQAQTGANAAAPAAQPLSVAVLPFAASTKELQDMAEEVPGLLTAYLSAEPSLILVERAELDKALSEIELGLSGTVDPATAAKIGYLAGAQVLVTGRAFPMQREIVIVVKIIGIETGRVYGETVTFPARGSITEAAQSLATSIGGAMGQRGPTLVARVEPKEDLITRLRREVEGRTLPSVSISIPEISLNRWTLDPAAETEIGFILQSLGFEIVDPLASNKAPDVEITGQAISEFALRRGNLVSSKGRVELKAIDRMGGKVLLVSREVSVAVDVAPEMAGKAAISKSAAKLVEQLVPILAALSPQ
jgi:hypothetical protein